MKKINISKIVSPSSKQPFTANSLKFKQDYDSENYAALIKALIISNLGTYSLTTPYVISGCVLSGAYNITAGEIFYGGSFYNVTALSSSVNPIRLILTTTYDAIADPLTFTDGVAKNVHEIYTYVSTDVTIGGILASSLVSVYATLVSYKYSFYNEIITYRDESTGTPPINTQAQIFTFTTPNDGITRDVLITLTSSLDANNPPVSFGYNSVIKKATVSVSTLSIQKPVGDTEIYVHNYLAQSVAPNTVFSIEDFRTASTSGAVRKSTLSVIGTHFHFLIWLNYNIN